MYFFSPRLRQKIRNQIDSSDFFLFFFEMRSTKFENFYWPRWRFFFKKELILDCSIFKMRYGLLFQSTRSLRLFMRRGSWTTPRTSWEIPRYGGGIFVLQNVGLAPWILPGTCANCSCFNSNFECISRLKVWEISWNLMEDIYIYMDIHGYTWIYETKLRAGVCSRRRGRQISKLPEFAVGWLALVSRHEYIPVSHGSFAANGSYQSLHPPPHFVCRNFEVGPRCSYESKCGSCYRKLGYMTWWYDMLSQVVQRWFFQLFFWFLRRSGILLRTSIFSKKSSCNRHSWYSSGSKWSTHSFGMPRHIANVIGNLWYPQLRIFTFLPRKKPWIEHFNATCWVFQNVASLEANLGGFFWRSHKRSGLPCWWTESSDLKCSWYRHGSRKRTKWFARCISGEKSSYFTRPGNHNEFTHILLVEDANLNFKLWAPFREGFPRCFSQSRDKSVTHIVVEEQKAFLLPTEDVSISQEIRSGSLFLWFTYKCNCIYNSRYAQWYYINMIFILYIWYIYRYIHNIYIYIYIYIWGGY